MAVKSDSLPPARRPLRVFAFDPSRGRLLGNEMKLNVRYRSLVPGPTDRFGPHDRIAVVDYDASRDKYYRPVNLDDPFVLISDGVAPSESDPRFHQQMVYAVASDTIEQFESALGRRIHWRRAERPLDAEKGWRPDDILGLVLYPHAMRQANAFYSPDAHGVLFGYFSAGDAEVGYNVPGQTVFTCLSHDIIVHEMTHAILDGMRSHFMEQTNPDVAAFHEAFADLVALFRHFTHRVVLLDAIQRTGGRLYASALKGDSLADQAQQAWLAAGDTQRNPLIEIAGQFGEATGMRTGLRSAIGKPKTMQELRNTAECHERGSILVAAVFDAFFTVYIQRTARLFRIYRAAGGGDREDLPAPLAEAVSDEATRTAQEFFRSCVRAIDYLPPVDVTFGDFLRAVLSAEKEFDPVDAEGVRRAWMEAFRRRGILPQDALSFSEEALCWLPRADDPPLQVNGLAFGGPLGFNYEQQRATAQALRTFIDANMETLHLDPKVAYRIPSFHQVYRVAKNGSLRWELVVEVVQTLEASATGRYPRRGGTTLMISTHGTGSDGEKDAVFLRYAVAKPLSGEEGERRAERQDAFLTELGIRPGCEIGALRVNFALVHQADSGDGHEHA
ncbi:MAG TPA: hypothetical protein VEQ87_04835 [Burkholderiales bacterium]|nr:hypothetical protein [Burkholderiales bacterium]